MKKYAFRLQTVLEIREKKLEDRRREMALVVAKLNEQLLQLEQLVDREKNARESLEEIYSGAKDLDITEVTNYKGFLGNIVQQQHQQQEVIKNTQNLLKLKQLQVTEAYQEVKVLEKLKETQEKKFYQHYEYVQAKEIDDIASTRYKKVLI